MSRSTKFVRVSQRGTRTVEVVRKFNIEVPPEIAENPDLLLQWVKDQESGGSTIASWGPVGKYWLDAGPVVILGPTHRADVPMNKAQKDFHASNSWAES